MNNTLNRIYSLKRDISLVKLYEIKNKVYLYENGDENKDGNRNDLFYCETGIHTSLISRCIDFEESKRLYSKILEDGSRVNKLTESDLYHGLLFLRIKNLIFNMYDYLNIENYKIINNVNKIIIEQNDSGNFENFYRIS